VTRASDFGEWLSAKRDQAGIGLRRFALQIGDSPSNVCNIENGNRKPWQNEPMLRKVAAALGIRENSDDWDTLFRSAVRADQAPPDLVRYMQIPLMPVLLRTVGEYQLGEEDVRRLLTYVKRTFGKSRSKKDV
jgi:transcriptional regulator with XRE-family HTH domain